MKPRQPQPHLLGARVRRLREANGWTLRDLGHRVSASAAHLLNIECGCSDPASATLRLLAITFGVSTDQLLGVRRAGLCSRCGRRCAHCSTARLARRP
jgi:transcriptional regulator with XRE-family HTH domain